MAYFPLRVLEKIQDLSLDGAFQTPPNFIELETKLNDAKRFQDDPKWRKNYGTTLRKADGFMSYKHELSKTFNAQNVSNAWLKAYETINTMKMIPDDQIVYLFDNASYPGAFVLAINHFVKTMTEKKDFLWVASSLSASEKGILDDDYKLYDNYQDRWLMDQDNNGDVTIPENIEDFYYRLGDESINLYTSDLGFHTDDYDNQERVHLLAQFGQDVSGLRILKKGGNFMTKRFTFFQPFTISWLRVISSFFDEFGIFKPISSRKTNSECYFIGKGYRGIDDKMLQQLYRRLETKNLSPMLDEIEPGFMEDVEAANQIYLQQIRALNDYQQYVNDGNETALKTMGNDDVIEWKTSNTVKKLLASARLRVKESIQK